MPFDIVGYIVIVSHCHAAAVPLKLLCALQVTKKKGTNLIFCSLTTPSGHTMQLGAHYNQNHPNR